MVMNYITLNDTQIAKLVKVLSGVAIPAEQESSTHSFVNFGDTNLLSNSYFAIVAICHQTSPLGERQLEGNINLVKKVGWDYLKEKFLEKAIKDTKWASISHWVKLRPDDLSELYEDSVFGKTLNRINERTFLLNDLGYRLSEAGFSNIHEAFIKYQGIIGGDFGFLSFLKLFEAYKDPVMKKAQFFLSIMKNELQWTIHDPENLSSPVDYHEIRGHVRLGTIIIKDPILADKVQYGLPISDQEDIEIRQGIQKTNDLISKQTGWSSSVIHYLFWNIFRNCCPRGSNKTHCVTCGDNCSLPHQYKEMEIYGGNCVFSAFCTSAHRADKTIDPPYLGHYY
jgi:hypothetical protein